MNEFVASTSKTRGVWTVSLAYGVSQKPQSTNNSVNHIINTKEGKDKPCDHLHSLFSPTSILPHHLPFSHSLHA